MCDLQSGLKMSYLQLGLAMSDLLSGLKMSFLQSDLLVRMPKESSIAADTFEGSTHEEISNANLAPAKPEHNITVVQEQQRKYITCEIVRKKQLQVLRDFGGVGEIAVALNSDLEEGLSCPLEIPEDEVIQPRLSLVSTVVSAFTAACNNYTIFLLCIAAACSFGFGVKEAGWHLGWLNGAIVASVVFLIVFLTTIKKYSEEMSKKRSENDWRSNGMNMPLKVVREGCTKDVSESDLEVGDIAVLEMGHYVPADGLFVTGQDLEINEGSSTNTRIDEENPFLYYGSRVINGINARMLVTSTRMDTTWGERMSEAMQDSANNENKFESWHHKLNVYVSTSGILLSILILLVHFVLYSLGKLDDERGDRPDLKGEPVRVKTVTDAIKVALTASSGTARSLTAWFSSILFGITEGMTFVTSVALVIWCRSRPAHKALTRDYQVPLKMGSVTIICIDEIGGVTEDTKRAISTLSQSGIRTIFFTPGDDVDALETIGEDGNRGHDKQVFRAEDFNGMSDEQKMNVVEKIQIIMGDCLPSDKIDLIKSLRKNGHVVAFLGQSAMDAPALKQADIGLTNGKGSSPIARGSSDIIIQEDDNFSFLVHAIENGRCFQANIRKFMQLQLTFIGSSLLINLVVVLSLGDAPITVVEFFFLNLVVPLFGGMALLTGPSTKEQMTTLTSYSSKHLMTNGMWRNIAIQTFYQTTVFFILQHEGHVILGISKGQLKSMIYNGFFTCQVFMIFTARELEKKNIFIGLFHKDIWFWVGSSLLLVCVGVSAELEHVFGSSPGWSWKPWVGCLLIGLGSWTMDLAGKTVSDFIASSAAVELEYGTQTI